MSEHHSTYMFLLGPKQHREGTFVLRLSVLMSRCTELCRHGIGSLACSQYGCDYAHALDELQIAPMRERSRYARGLCCRFFGQTMTPGSHQLIMYYFDEEVRSGREIPAWAHCYVWAYRHYPVDYRMDLGDFGVRRDYDQWVLSSGNRPAIFEFPAWLSAMLAWRRSHMQAHPRFMEPELPVDAPEAPMQVQDTSRYNKIHKR